jgi:hypothetical protein
VLDYAGTIGPAGGLVSAYMGRVKLDFSPGAVSEDVDIRVSPLANVGVPGIITPTVFVFGPDGATFSAPVILTLTYDEGNLPDGNDESSDLFILGTSHDGDGLENLLEFRKPGSLLVRLQLAHAIEAGFDNGFGIENLEGVLTARFAQHLRD